MNKRSPTVLNRIVIHLFFLAAAAVVSWYFTELRFSHFRLLITARLDDLIRGTAFLPWQYRDLIPEVIRLLDSLNVHPPVFDTVGLRSFVSSNRLVFSPALNLAAWSELTFTFLLVVSFRSYLSGFFRDLKTRSLLAFSVFYPLVFTFLLPDRLNIYYPYDLASVTFFTLGLLLIYKRRWLLFYPLFALATWNKETSCFLTMIYFLTAIGKEEWKTIFARCLAQFLIWVGVLCCLRLTYLENPGWPLMAQFTPNIELLTGRSYGLGPFPLLLSALGYIWIPVVIFYRRIENPFVRRALWVTVPFLGAVLYGCNIHEVRDYGELIPVYLPALLLIIKNLLNSNTPEIT